MKLTDIPTTDDLKELQKLADRDSLGSYPALMHEYITIKEQYRIFIENKGDPWKIPQAALDSELKNKIIGHYLSPPKDCLEFIAHDRYNKSPTICLMCGGFGMGTLDHYLPKDVYPEFSFFSANLIPACNCNFLRGTTHKGVESAQRVIHAYFDTFVTDRLYQVNFTGDFETPHITVEVADRDHPNKDTLEFHLENVILNKSTFGFLDKYWSDLVVRPDDILNVVLPEDSAKMSIAEFMSVLTKYRNSKDREYGTPNNWYSMLYTGLLKDGNRVGLLLNIINSSRT